MKQVLTVKLRDGNSEDWFTMTHEDNLRLWLEMDKTLF